MEAVVGLLLMILGVSHGGETYCDGRQSGAQCYGALGGTVVIRLMDNASEIFRWDWKKGSSVILIWINKTIQTNIIKDRSLFNPSDGTFRINDLSRDDSGQYNLTCFVSNGTASSEQTLQLFIQVTGYLPLIAGVVSALVIFLVVGLAVIWAQKKRQRNNKPKEEENDQELTYADVRVTQQQRRQAEQRPNVEVEYGQVKISARPRQTEK